MKLDAYLFVWVRRPVLRPLLAALVLFGLGGCALTPDTPPSRGGNLRVSAEHAAADATATPSRARRGDAASGASSAAAEPVAVIELTPTASELSAEMDARLRTVAEAAKADERIALRLEGYVPDGGSPVLNIGLAEQSLAVVRRQLIRMGVAANRIQIVPLGEHHEFARSADQHWVEIHFRARPG